MLLSWRRGLNRKASPLCDGRKGCKMVLFCRHVRRGEKWIWQGASREGKRLCPYLYAIRSRSLPNIQNAFGVWWTRGGSASRSPRETGRSAGLGLMCAPLSWEKSKSNLLEPSVVALAFTIDQSLACALLGERLGRKTGNNPSLLVLFLLSGLPREVAVYGVLVWRGGPSRWRPE